MIAGNRAGPGRRNRTVGTVAMRAAEAPPRPSPGLGPAMARPGMRYDSTVEGSHQTGESARYTNTGSRLVAAGAR